MWSRKRTKKSTARSRTSRSRSTRSSRTRKGKPIQRLYRSGTDRIIGGVCGGIGEYLGWDPVVVRLLWVIGTLAWLAGLLLYIIAWIIIPRNPKHKW